MDDIGETISIDGAARRLGVTRRAVHKYIAQGKLRAFKRPVGGRTAIPVADVDALFRLAPFSPKAAKR